MITRNTTFRRLATAALASAFGTALLAAPAAAEVSVFKDAHGDLDHGADIHRVRVVNGDMVKVKVVHEDLVRSYRSGSSLAVFIDTDRARRGPEYVFQAGTFEGADYALLKADGWKAASRQAEPLRGGSYMMKLDYEKDTAVITMSRKILGDPGAVRVDVKTGGELVPSDSEPATTDVDWLGERRDFTPWVKRG